MEIEITLNHIVLEIDDSHRAGVEGTAGGFKWLDAIKAAEWALQEHWTSTKEGPTVNEIEAI